MKKNKTESLFELFKESDKEVSGSYVVDTTERHIRIREPNYSAYITIYKIIRTVK